MNHEHNLAKAFDGQAARFERAPVQTDPTALGRLIEAADFPGGAYVVDAGCGPGLVSRALLDAGRRVVGVDLSQQMIERARRRCADRADKAQFFQKSIFDASLDALAPFDGAISRYVLHHTIEPREFLARQVALLRPGGVVVACDHITDAFGTRAAFHREIEVLRDKTHTRNLTSGQLADLFASVGLIDIRLHEESFVLDFDEWFDRGTPSDSKENVRRRLLSGQPARGFTASPQPDGKIPISCIRTVVRGVKPAK
ncbi:MAG: class I SAM-dependent methyltransferase [Syntrophobacteraceae bacterium]|nr:class I SAM-dependent methyltransferase [Syntrophobacteraceae bacterium]